MRKLTSRLWMTLLALALAVPAVRAQDPQQAPACSETPGFHRLDFWLGDWDVQVKDRTVGRNRIEAILDGCAVAEHWRSAAGGEGRSLFYYQPATGTWRQVWVTARATAPGGVKEKQLIEDLPGGGVRFQGEIPMPGGGSYLDRTSLIPEAGGRVRQLIEISRDGGASWQATFDAVYVPREQADRH